jgi:hypothetical protein
MKKAQSSSRKSSPNLDRSRKVSSKQSSSNSSEQHFASSAFMNSPDPSKLPIPDFDDDDNESTISRLSSSCSSRSTSPLAVSAITGRKTDTLKQFLNIGGSNKALTTVSNN